VIRVLKRTTIDNERTNDDGGWMDECSGGGSGWAVAPDVLLRRDEMALRFARLHSLPFLYFVRSVIFCLSLSFAEEFDFGRGACRPSASKTADIVTAQSIANLCRSFKLQ
jgi:hypothetical protein